MEKLLLFYAFFLIILCGCESKKTDNNSILARYNDSELHLEDLNGIMPIGTSSQDSILITQKFVDKWIKDQVFLNEALNSKNLDLIEIESKISEYKNALIIYEYQKQIIGQQVDTSISDDEYKSFYKQHAKDFELKQNIVKGIILKCRGYSPSLKRLSETIKKINDCDKSLPAIELFCQHSAEAFTIETQNWIPFDVLVKQSPFAKIQNKTDWLSKNNISIVTDGEYSYLIKIFDCKLENRISPIDYIKEQIKSIILNSRKVKLLEDYEERIYKKALSEKDIETFN